MPDATPDLNVNVTKPGMSTAMQWVAIIGVPSVLVIYGTFYGIPKVVEVLKGNQEYLQTTAKDTAANTAKVIAENTGQIVELRSDIKDGFDRSADLLRDLVGVQKKQLAAAKDAAEKLDEPAK